MGEILSQACPFFAQGVVIIFYLTNLLIKWQWKMSLSLFRNLAYLIRLDTLHVSCTLPHFGDSNCYSMKL